MLIFSN